MWDGEDFSMNVDVDTDSGESYSFELEGTITYGMPDKEVEDDRRFEVDTKDAYEVDLGDMFGYWY